MGVGGVSQQDVRMSQTVGKTPAMAQNTLCLPSFDTLMIWDIPRLYIGHLKSFWGGGKLCIAAIRHHTIPTPIKTVHEQ